MIKKNISILLLTLICLCRTINVFAEENCSFGDVENMIPINRVVVEPDDKLRANKVCLTFDCAYVNDNVKDILDILDYYGIKATFFSTLEFIKAHPETITDIINRGHDLGSHSVNHPHFNKISDDAVYRQVLNTHQYVHDNFGIDMWLFRYPYGESNSHNMSIVTSLGYFPINWSLDSLDWKNDGLAPLCYRVTQHKYTPGEILLFHASGEFTVKALPSIIDFITQLGYGFLPVSKMIYYNDFSCEWGNMKRKMP